jgi:hypothetical protein
MKILEGVKRFALGFLLFITMPIWGTFGFIYKVGAVGLDEYRDWRKKK